MRGPNLRRLRDERAQRFYAFLLNLTLHLLPGSLLSKLVGSRDINGAARSNPLMPQLCNERAAIWAV
jgi:hypothetical protein